METGKAVPVFRDHHLHPFGKDFAHIYTNYTNFVAAPPDESFFDIPNLKYCERGDDSQCGTSVRTGADAVADAKARLAARLARMAPL